jgi:hypothetical protein
VIRKATVSTWHDQKTLATGTTTSDHRPEGRATVLVTDATEATDVNGDTEPMRQSTSAYTVLGDLVLPRPPRDLQECAEKWERALQILDGRNMTGELVIIAHACGQNKSPFMFRSSNSGDTQSFRTVPSSIWILLLQSFDFKSNRPGRCLAGRISLPSIWSGHLDL